MKQRFALTVGKMLRALQTLLTIGFALTSLVAQETHDHPAPAQLGEVSFPVSCKPSVQREFDRGVALLHSFMYTPAEEAFRSVADHDPRCAIAHWGIAMTHFHQLWEPPIPPSSTASAAAEIEQGEQLGAATERERKFIHAAGLMFRNADSVPYKTRVLNYEQAMSDLAAENKNDLEVKVFYALALLANASPADRTHAKQKQAADILEPLFVSHPLHPGIPHYLIHACDSTALASRGLSAAKAYSKIAPSAPHALHMPSHIFTRLGLWEESIGSNTAARDAARRLGDTAEELHAMDYLVYAYLQSGHDADAAEVIQQLRTMPKLNTGDFKIGYASTAMPIRYLLERRQWADAALVAPPAVAPPHVTAIAVWAKGLGLARSGHAADTPRLLDELQNIETQLDTSGNEYWAIQVRVMKREVMAWSAQADKKPDEAATLMRQAADEEDSIEKLPVTPGPIVPAREQLADLLLEQGHADLASQEFQAALMSAPGRRGSLRGAAEASQHLRQNRN